MLPSWIRTHDPVSVDDRQIVLLESITVNMDQVKAAVSAVSTLLAGEVCGVVCVPGVLGVWGPCLLLESARPARLSFDLFCSMCVRHRC